MRLQRPGNTFCVGVVGGLIALHYHWNGWLIFVVALAIGWALNEDERRAVERDRL